MTPVLWFYDHGIGVFPVRTPGKEPACSSWDDYRCARAQAARFGNYGVRLGRLGVADSDTPGAEAWVARNLPSTPLIVETARGRHRYYRLDGPAPKFIHRDGHTIEFRNQGQYVVGPGSVHPTGVIYTASDWSWQWDDLPLFPTGFVFDDRPVFSRGSAGEGAPFTLPPKVFAGERHDMLWRLLRSIQARGVDVNIALAACHAENHARCQPPVDPTALDAYLRRVAKRPDREEFVRARQTGWELAAGLLETGLSVEAVLAVVKAVSPDFDPERVDD